MKDNNKGSLILYSVFFMMAISAVAMLTATIILTNIKATGNSTRSITAYYAAESGIEQGLYKLKYCREKHQLVSEALTKTMHPHLSSNYVRLLNNPAVYTMNEATNNYKNSLTFSLDQYETEEINISDPDTGASILAHNSQIYITWSDYTIISPATQCDVEITENEYTVSSSFNPIITSNIYTNSTPNPYGLTQNLTYKFFIKPLNCELNNISVSIRDSITNNYINFPNYVRITATGASGQITGGALTAGNTYALQTETIWRPSVSGLTTFVLFSEDPIVKNN